MTALLTTNGVSVRFGGLTAVDAVDIAVPEGAIHGVIGPNGAGKTTFFNLITGHLWPDKGSVSFEGRDLVGLPGAAREDARGQHWFEGSLEAMSIDASAKNMQAVCKAKEQHDKTCPWGGKGTEVHLNWFDIDRMGWEEGDVICGLVVIGDSQVPTGRMRVTCDAEGDGGGRTEEEEVESVEAVAAERELQPAAPSLN